MTTESRTPTEVFPPAMLTQAVRNALNAPTGILADWHCEPVHGGLSAVGGVYRITGHLRYAATFLSWSLILKVLGKINQDDSLTSPFYWGREPMIYQSQLRDFLPPGLAMPHCVAVTENETACWMWMEDLGEMRANSWSIAQYGRVARSLGQFNGTFLVNAPPTWEWLSRNWLPVWIQIATAETVRLPTVREHPLVQRWFPDQDFARIMDHWDNREQLLQVLAQLPHTLCHLDAHRRNMLTRSTSTGRDVTTLIDWAGCGMAALGEELVWLIWASYSFFEVDPSEIDALEATVLNQYVAGLRDVGWRGDERIVQVGYAIGAVFRNAVALGLDAVLDTDQHAGIEQAVGQSIERCMDRWADTNHRVLRALDRVQAWIGQI